MTSSGAPPRAPDGIYGHDHAAPLDAIHRAGPSSPGAPPAAAIELFEGGAAAPPGLLAIDGATLRIAPFVVHRFGLRYRSAGPIRIGLAGLADDAYRIVAIHDFRSEDCNSDLEEAVAAVFLARRIDGRWQEPEGAPVECRGVALLGRLDLCSRSVGPA
jgi:hypothetical protein